jgi:glycosyltransferase involved in cell wall biosynthesis
MTPCGHESREEDRLADPGARSPRVAILINNRYVADSRAWKIATSLGRAGYDVTVVAREGDGLPEHEDRGDHRVTRIAQPRPLGWLPVPRLPDAADSTADRRAWARARFRDTAGRAAQAGRYLVLSRAWARRIGQAVDGIDVWQAEEIMTLPLAVTLRARHGGRVVYDANDIDTEAGRFARLPPWWRTLLKSRERAWARSVDAVVTVSPPYADVLGRMLRRPVDAVVRNAPTHYEPPDPPERRFHAAFDLPAEMRVVLYLGQVMEGRGLRQLFEAIALVDRAVLVVAGFGPDYERYRALAAGLPHAARIRFMGEIRPDEIPAWNASADVAAMPVQPDTLNHRLNTPTKLYDAMGAGVPVVASDLPGITPLVTETGCGELCDPTDPADIARAIRTIVDAPAEAREAYRERCLAAARGPYSWDRQAAILMEVYERIGIPRPRAPTASSSAAEAIAARRA